MAVVASGVAAAASEAAGDGNQVTRHKAQGQRLTPNFQLATANWELEVGSYGATFKHFPPRQKAASFTIDQVMEKMEASLSRD